MKWRITADHCHIASAVVDHDIKPQYLIFVTFVAMQRYHVALVYIVVCQVDGVSLYSINLPPLARHLMRFWCASSSILTEHTIKQQCIGLVQSLLQHRARLAHLKVACKKLNKVNIRLDHDNTFT